MGRLRRGDNGRVVAWENKRGTAHSVENQEGEKTGRNPSDKQIENARRVVIRVENNALGEYEFVTVTNLTPDYTIDEVIDELVDRYVKQ